MTTASATCLILTSRHGQTAEFSSALAAALGKTGVDAITVDEIAIQGAISDSILQAIQRASAVAVEISDQDPNVMYYIGLAHAWRKRVYLFARRGTARIPQALAGDVVYSYELQSTSGLDEAAASISQQIRQWS